MNDPLLFWMIVAILSLVYLIRSALQYEHVAHSFGHQVAIKETLPSLGYDLLLIGFLAFVFTIPPVSREFVLISFCWTIATCSWVGLIVFIWQQFTVGSVLLRFERDALIWLVLGLIGILMLRSLAELTEALTALNVAYAAMTLSATVLLALLSWRSTLVTETGILYGLNFIRWDHIQCYSFFGRHDVALRLKVKQHLGTQNIRIVIPANLISAIRQMLQQKLADREMPALKT